MDHWSVERTELLRKLWGEGLSASAIAARMGGVTRSAVIGKAHRLQLARRKSANPEHIANNRRAAALRRMAKAAKPARPPRQPKAPWHFEMGGSTPAERARSAADFARLQAEIAARQDVVRVSSIIDLEPHHCRWPIGEPTRGFCGAAKVYGASYCAHHLARSIAKDNWYLRLIDNSSPVWVAPEIDEPVAA